MKVINSVIKNNARTILVINLMLISLDGKISDIVAGIDRIREHPALRENVPTIIFCAEESKEADESNIGRNIYFTCPDNFNNLRNFISRLLRSPKSL